MLLFSFLAPASREQRKPGRQGVDGWKEVEQTRKKKKRKKSQQMSDVKMRGRGKRDEDGKQWGKFGNTKEQETVKGI